MEPIYFTVTKISGDYCFMVSDQGVENQVALALVPDEVEEGIRLLWENFSFSLA